MQRDSDPDGLNTTSSSNSSSSSGSSDSEDSSSYDSDNTSSSDDKEKTSGAKDQDRTNSSEQLKSSRESIKTGGDPCYEDFMPGKDSDRSFVPPQSTGAPEPEKAEEKNFSKEDLIDILSEALYRSAQKENRGTRQKRERKPDISSEEGGDEEVDEPVTTNQEDREHQKVLGSLASSVLSKKRKENLSPLVRAGTSKKTGRPPNARTSNLSWKKKLEAIKKAHLQLSNRVAALIELAE